LNKKSQRIVSVLIIALIIIHGTLKPQLLILYSNLISTISLKIGVTDFWLFSFLSSQALKPSLEKQAIGWLIFYPSYIFLHAILAYTIFYNSPKLRYYIVINIIGIAIFTISFWSISLILELPKIALFSRRIFQSLFGLPLALLAIEGGKIFLNDIDKRLNQ
jgi:hypothetical protein